MEGGEDGIGSKAETHLYLENWSFSLFSPSAPYVLSGESDTDKGREEL